MVVGPGATCRLAVELARLVDPRLERSQTSVTERAGSTGEAPSPARSGVSVTRRVEGLLKAGWGATEAQSQGATLPATHHSGG
jgi:hypothetical protein